MKKLRKRKKKQNFNELQQRIDVSKERETKPLKLEPVAQENARRAYRFFSHKMKNVFHVKQTKNDENFNFKPKL